MLGAAISHKSRFQRFNRKQKKLDSYSTTADEQVKVPVIKIIKYLSYYIVVREKVNK